MIIDAHSHWLPAKIIENAHFYHKGWGDIDAQVKMMKESGIDQAVLTYPTSDAHVKLGSFNEAARIYNNSIAEIMERYPRRFIGAAILPVGNSKEVMDEFKRAMDSGFKA
ncbi:MAG: amidohydrolase family protein, partial [Candidatus Omnitrophica bacterium]|nr:amidohydrolase family protein [Candidatus Omnitrophota bacterium]